MIFVVWPNPITHVVFGIQNGDQSAQYLVDNSCFQPISCGLPLTGACVPRHIQGQIGITGPNNWH